ncbi:diacylglycerol kinase [Alphaproteobacteria bacterium]|nr:diacylglycerol kinase [Alphaproteobacteria bacterium]
MDKNQNIYLATLNAISGFKVLLEERSAKREILLILLIACCFWYKQNLYTFTLVLLSIILISVEALNSSLERLCDFLTSDIDPSIRKIKDLAACAVFFLILAIIFIFFCWFFNLVNLSN